MIMKIYTGHCVSAKSLHNEQEKTLGIKGKEVTAPCF